MGKVPFTDVHEKSDAMTLISLIVKEFTITCLWSLDAIGIIDLIIQKSREEKELESKVNLSNEGK